MPIRNLEIIGIVLDKDNNILVGEAQLDPGVSESPARMGDTIRGFCDLATALNPAGMTRTSLGRIQVHIYGTRRAIMD